MTIYPESIDTDLSRLLTDVQNGSMQLPEFQRYSLCPTKAP